MIEEESVKKSIWKKENGSVSKKGEEKNNSFIEKAIDFFTIDKKDIDDAKKRNNIFSQEKEKPSPVLVIWDINLKKNKDGTNVDKNIWPLIKEAKGGKIVEASEDALSYLDKIKSKDYKYLGDIDVQDTYKAKLYNNILEEEREEREKDNKNILQAITDSGKFILWETREGIKDTFWQSDIDQRYVEWEFAPLIEKIKILWEDETITFFEWNKASEKAKIVSEVIANNWEWLVDLLDEVENYKKNTITQYINWQISENDADRNINDFIKQQESVFNETLEGTSIRKADNSLFTFKEMRELVDLADDYYKEIRKDQEEIKNIIDNVSSRFSNIKSKTYNNVKDFYNTFINKSLSDQDKNIITVAEQREIALIERDNKLLEKNNWDILRTLRGVNFNVEWRKAEVVLWWKIELTKDQLSQWVEWIMSFTSSEIADIRQSEKAIEILKKTLISQWEMWSNQFKRLSAFSREMDRKVNAMIEWAKQLAEHYIQNYWKEWYQSQSEYISKLKEDWIDIQKIFGFAWVEALTDMWWTLTSSMADIYGTITDGEYASYYFWEAFSFSWKNRLKNIIKWSVQTLWSLLWGIDTIFESFSTKINSDSIGKIEWWSLKNAMFYITPMWSNAESIAKIKNSLIEMWPEVLSTVYPLFLTWWVSLWVNLSSKTGSITKWVQNITKGLSKITWITTPSIKSLWIYKYLPNLPTGIARLMKGISETGQLLYRALDKWEDISRFLNQAISNQSQMTIARHLTNGIYNFAVRWPIYSWIFEKFNPWVYSDEDLAFDIAFGAGELAFDIYRWIKASSNIAANISWVINNVDFQTSFAKRSFWVSNAERDNMRSYEKDILKKQAKDFFETAYQMNAVLRNQDPENYDKAMSFFSSILRKNNKTSVEEIRKTFEIQRKNPEEKITEFLKDAELKAEVSKGSDRVFNGKKVDATKEWSLEITKSWIPITYIWWTPKRTWDEIIDWYMKDRFDADNYYDFFAKMSQEWFEKTKIRSENLWRISPKYALMARLEWRYPELINEAALKTIDKDSFLWILNNIKEEASKKAGKNITSDDFVFYTSDQVNEQLANWMKSGFIYIWNEQISWNEIQSVLNMSPMRAEKITDNIEKDILIFAYMSVMHSWVRTSPKTIAKRTLLQSILAKILDMKKLSEIPWELDRPVYQNMLIDLAKRQWFNETSTRAMIDSSPKLMASLEEFFTILGRENIEVVTDKSVSQLVAEYIERSIRDGDITMLSAIKKNPSIAVADLIAKSPDAWKMLPDIKILGFWEQMQEFTIPNPNWEWFSRIFSDKDILNLKRVSILNLINGKGYIEEPLDYVTDAVIGIIKEKFPTLNNTQAVSLWFMVTGNKNLQKYWSMTNKADFASNLQRASDEVVIARFERNVPKQIDKLEKAIKRLNKIEKPLKDAVVTKEVNRLKKRRDVLEKKIISFENNIKSLKENFSKWWINSLTDAQKRQVKKNIVKKTQKDGKIEKKIITAYKKTIKELQQKINVAKKEISEQKTIDELQKDANTLKKIEHLKKKFGNRIKKIKKAQEIINDAIAKSDDPYVVMDAYFNNALSVLPESIRINIQEAVGKEVLGSSSDIYTETEISALVSAIEDTIQKYWNINIDKKAIEDADTLLMKESIDALDALNRALNILIWNQRAIDANNFNSQKTIDEFYEKAIKAVDDWEKKMSLRYQVEIEKSIEKNVDAMNDVFVANNFIGMWSIKSILWESYLKLNSEIEAFLTSSNISKVRYVDNWWVVKEIPLWVALYSIARDNSIGNYQALELLIDMWEWIAGKWYRTTISNALSSFLSFVWDRMRAKWMTINGEVPDTTAFISKYISKIKWLFSQEGEDWLQATRLYIEKLKNPEFRIQLSKKDFETIASDVSIPVEKLKELIRVTWDIANDINQLANMVWGRARTRWAITAKKKTTSSIPAFFSIDALLNKFSNKSFRNAILSRSLAEWSSILWINSNNIDNIAWALENVLQRTSWIDQDKLFDYIFSAQWEASIGRRNIEDVAIVFWVDNDTARQIIEVTNSMYDDLYKIISPNLNKANDWFVSDWWILSKITWNISEFVDETRQIWTFSLNNFLSITDHIKYWIMTGKKWETKWYEAMKEFFWRDISKWDYNILVSIFTGSNWLDWVSDFIKNVLRAWWIIKALLWTFLSAWVQLVATTAWILWSHIRKWDYDFKWAKAFSEEFGVWKTLRNYSDEVIYELWWFSPISTFMNILAKSFGTSLWQIREAFRSIATQGYYQIIENIYSESYMALAMSKALVARWFGDFSEYARYLRWLTTEERIKELWEFRIISDTIVETQTGTLFNPTMSRLMWNSRTIMWSIPTSEKWKVLLWLRNVVYYAGSYLSTRWFGHMKNYWNMIKDKWAIERNIYSEILANDWYKVANDYLRNKFIRDYRANVAIWQIITTLWIASKLSRSEDDINMFEASQFLLSPLQALESSSFWRIVWAMFKQLFHDDVGVYEAGTIKNTAIVWYTQFMQELGRVFQIPSDILIWWSMAIYDWLKNDRLWENIDWLFNALISRLWWYNKLLADDIQRNAYSFKSNIASRDLIYSILPIWSPDVDMFYDLSLQQKIEELDRSQTSDIISRWLHKLPFMRSMYNYQFGKESKEEKLLQKVYNSEAYSNLILWDNPSVADSDFSSEHFYYRMTRPALQTYNTIWERAGAKKIKLSDFDNDGIKNINTWQTLFEEWMLKLLEKSLEEWKYTEFVDIMNKENDIWVKQWTYILTMLEAQSPWSWRELLALVVRQQYDMLTRKLSKDLWYSFSRGKFFSDLEPELDKKIKASIVDNWLAVYREVDKVGFSEATNAYIYDKLIPEWEDKNEYFSWVVGADWNLEPYWTITPWSYESKDWWSNFWSSKIKRQKMVYDISLMALMDERVNTMDMNNIFTTLFMRSAKEMNNEEAMVSIGNMAIQAMDYIQSGAISEDRKIAIKAGIATATAPYVAQILDNEELMSKHWDHFTKMYSYLWKSFTDLDYLKDDMDKQKKLEEMWAIASEVIVDMMDWEWWGWKSYDNAYKAKFGVWWVMSSYSKITQGKNLIRKFNPQFSKIPKNIDGIDRPKYNKTAQSLLQLKWVLRDVWRLSEESELRRSIPKLRYAKWTKQRYGKVKKLKIN